jgi:hypothetical protein
LRSASEKKISTLEQNAIGKRQKEKRGHGIGCKREREERMGGLIKGGNGYREEQMEDGGRQSGRLGTITPKNSASCV